MAHTERCTSMIKLRTRLRTLHVVGKYYTTELQLLPVCLPTYHPSINLYLSIHPSISIYSSIHHPPYSLSPILSIFHLCIIYLSVYISISQGLALQSRLTLNSPSSCLSFPSSGVFRHVPSHQA